MRPTRHIVCLAALLSLQPPSALLGQVRMYGPGHEVIRGDPVTLEYPEVLAELTQRTGPRTAAELDSIADLLVEWATAEEVIEREGLTTAVNRSVTTLRMAADPETGLPYERAFETVVRIFEATVSANIDWWAAANGLDLRAKTDAHAATSTFALVGLILLDESRAAGFLADIATRPDATACLARRQLSNYLDDGDPHPLYVDLRRANAFQYRCPELDRDPDRR